MYIAMVEPEDRQAKRNYRLTNDNSPLESLAHIVVPRGLVYCNWPV
jgi:hypothetical protein